MKKILIMVTVLSTVLFSCKKDNSVTPSSGAPLTLQAYLSGHNISTQYVEHVTTAGAVSTTTPTYRDSLNFPTDLSGMFIFQYIIDTNDPSTTDNWYGEIHGDTLIVRDMTPGNPILNKWLFKHNPRHYYEYNRTFPTGSGEDWYVHIKY